MKLKKLYAALLTTVLSFSMLTGCTGLKTFVSVTDNTLYQFQSDDMTPCYLNNVMMYVENDILKSDTLKGYVDSYTLELYDDDTFLLLCNMDQTELEDMTATDAKDCLADYFEDTAVSLNLDKIEGKYCMADDISPTTGKSTTFYKILFSGVKINVNKTSFEGQAALLAYEDICIAAIIGTVEDGLTESEISNMMKSVAFIESEDLSTGDGSKPSYKVPDDLQIDFETGDEDDWNDDDDNQKDNDLDDDLDDDQKDDDRDENDWDNDDDDDDTSFGHKTDTSLDVYATTFKIDKTRFSCPITYDDLLEAGMTPDIDPDTLVESNGIETATFVLDDDNFISVYFVNVSEEDMPLSSCFLYGINVDADYLSSSTTVTIGDSLVLGETTKDELLASAPAEPDYEFEDGSYYTVSYEEFNGEDSENCFTFWDDILISVTMYFDYE